MLASHRWLPMLGSLAYAYYRDGQSWYLYYFLASWITCIIFVLQWELLFSDETIYFRALYSLVSFSLTGFAFEQQPSTSDIVVPTVFALVQVGYIASLRGMFLDPTGVSSTVLSFSMFFFVTFGLGCTWYGYDDQPKQKNANEADEDIQGNLIGYLLLALAFHSDNVFRFYVFGDSDFLPFMIASVMSVPLVVYSVYAVCKYINNKD